MRITRLSPSAPWRVLALSVAMMVVLAACTGSGSVTGSQSEGGESGGDVAATVGDVEIAVADVDAAYERRAEPAATASEIAADSTGDVEQSLRAGVLTNLVRTEILRQAAAERGIEVTDDEVAEQREQLIEQAGGEEAFQEVVEQANISEDELEANLRDQVIQTKITSELAEVDDAAVQDAFENDPQGRYGEKVEVRHILTETRKQAEDVIDRIESGDDFAEVASEVSIDPGSGAQGGNLGEIGRGATVPPFEKAAFGAEVGELVGPVKSQFGFHVIEVTNTVPAPALADVESEIRTELEAQLGSAAFNDFITQFVTDLEITVDERYGEWDEDAVAVIPPSAASEAPAAPASDAPAPLPSELSS